MPDDRPKLTERMTFRLPEELKQDVTAQATRLGVSENEVVLTALENEFGRLRTHRLPYYGQLRTLLVKGQDRHCPTISRNVGHDSQEAA